MAVGYYSPFSPKSPLTSSAHPSNPNHVLSVSPREKWAMESVYYITIPYVAPSRRGTGPAAFRKKNYEYRGPLFVQ